MRFARDPVPRVLTSPSDVHLQPQSSQARAFPGMRSEYHHIKLIAQVEAGAVES